MHKAMTMKVLAHCPSVTSKDVRRAYAVTEVQRLKKLQTSGRLGTEQYLTYLKEIHQYVEHGDEAPTPRVSGVYPKMDVDSVLIDYLMGWDDDSADPEEKRILGSW